VTPVRALVADRVRVPFRRPFPTSTGMWVEREAWLLRVVDDGGRLGLGEAVLDDPGDEVGAAVLAGLIREAVDAVEAPGGNLPSGEELATHGAPGRAVRAALDAALLDLQRSMALPSTRPDGDGVPVNATVASLGPAAAAEAARQAVESGFTTLKVKAGAERETVVLLDRVRAIREAIGPDVRLRLDVNGAWDLSTAEERLGAVLPFDIEFVEQPLTADDIDGLASLRRRVRVPVAADEGAASIALVRSLLAADAVDVLVIKSARVGGPTVVAEIAEIAAERGIPVVVSTLFETGVGIAAGLAAAAALPVVRPEHLAATPDHGLATAGLLEHDLLRESLIVEDGRMFAPSSPDSGGLGIELDPRALERYRIDAVGAIA
jgi:L-Ala-D/L-Glu epimerase